VSSSDSKKIPSRITSTAEFARYVGLARSTVSRVLNRQPGLKQSTIDRVHHALAETGFTPNAYATLLKGKGTSSVGICMENLLTPPILLKLATLQRQLRSQGYTSLIEVYARAGPSSATFFPCGSKRSSSSGILTPESWKHASGNSSATKPPTWSLIITAFRSPTP
jgi:transcriptional regulator with XRE-family HTH domain